MLVPETILKTLSDIPVGIRGIGNDLVFLPQFQQSLHPTFIKRAFTVQEREYCEQFENPTIRYASTWAGKEAVYKAVKQYDDLIKLWWRDIEILRNKPQGKPTVIIKKLPSIKISLTLTHDGDYAWALAVISGAKT